MRHIHIVCLFAALFVAACGKNAQKEVEKLHKETLAIHDDAMILIAQMKRMGRSLKQELSAQDSLSSERRQKLLEALSQMEAADEDMMNWMRDFSMPHGMKHEAALRYLNEQKTLIQKNHADISAAIESAKQLVNQ
ncbi:MAG: hypothetical protein ACK4NS_09805 [Saprospiraceae bacterium]